LIVDVGSLNWVHTTSTRDCVFKCFSW
jgi:hypothetical protein